MKQLERIKRMGIRNIVKKIVGYEEIYAILYRDAQKNPIPAFKNKKNFFNRIPESKEYWYADPMLYEHGRELWLFMEAFSYRTQRGELACAMLQPDGTFSEPEVILREPYHLSFPLVFDWEDGIYLMPECSENNLFTLYYCKEFPRRWEKACEIKVEDRLVDSILLEKKSGHLEILTSALKSGDPFQTIFQRFRLEREGWKLQKMMEYNSKQLYGYDTRNAGQLFELAGTVYHPVQVSTDMDYGVSMKIFQYKGMDEREVYEKLAGMIDCASLQIEGIRMQDRIGVHSYCYKGGLEVVDIRYFRFRPRKWVDRLQSRWRR